MEQGDWALLEDDDEGLVSRAAAERVMAHSADGCLMCALEEWEDE